MPNLTVAMGSSQNDVNQRGTQREAGGWASAGRMPSSQEQKSRVTWQGKLLIRSKWIPCTSYRGRSEFADDSETASSSARSRREPGPPSRAGRD